MIIEYRSALYENVISQCPYYLDWMIDHQGEFTLQVMKRLAPECSEKTDWSGPHLLVLLIPRSLARNLLVLVGSGVIEVLGIVKVPFVRRFMPGFLGAGEVTVFIGQLHMRILATLIIRVTGKR